MMEAARSSETSVNFYQTTWRYNPEDSHPQLDHETDHMLNSLLRSIITGGLPPHFLYSSSIVLKHIGDYQCFLSTQYNFCIWIVVVNPRIGHLSDGMTYITVKGNRTLSSIKKKFISLAVWCILEWCKISYIEINFQHYFFNWWW
jgi:hypothetical protein